MHSPEGGPLDDPLSLFLPVRPIHFGIFGELGGLINKLLDGIARAPINIYAMTQTKKRSLLFERLTRMICTARVMIPWTRRSLNRIT